MLKLKVCGMRELANIIELDALGPDMIGFIYHASSPRFVGNAYKPIGTIKALKVGVFVNAEFRTISTIAKNADLNMLQLHGDETVDYCASLSKQGFSLIKSFGINQQPDYKMIEAYLPYCKYLLFDTASKQRGGTGKQFKWELLGDYPFDHPFFLSGGIDIDAIEMIRAFNHPACFGIDINSRFEMEPGLKNIEKIKHFINAIRQ